MHFSRVFGLALLPLISAYKLYTHDDAFVPDAILRVTAVNVSLGCIDRYSVLVNGTSPGPELRFREGEVKWVRVYNDMENYNLTMHWHGLSQAAYPFSDGTPQASQWPIAPKHFFDYELEFNDNAGSYFYHSHVGFQAVTAAGPLIIEDKRGKHPYHYHDDRIVFLQDLYAKTDTQVETGLRNATFVWSGETNAVLVNGVGITNQNVTTNNCTSCGLDTIKVDPGKTYRLRFIGATAISFLSLGLEGHTMDIIEADGSYTKKHNVDYLQIATGQRFSTLIKTKTCEQLAADNKLQYYMQMETRERPENVTAFAIMDYSNSCNLTPATTLSKKTFPTKKPLSLPPTQLGWLDYVLEPLQDNNFPALSEVTRRVIVTVQQIINSTNNTVHNPPSDNNAIIWDQDNKTWTEYVAPVPYLVALYLDEKTYLPDLQRALANKGVDPVTGTFPAEIGEVLDIVIQNSGSTGGTLDMHASFHAHAAHYYDLGSGNGTYNVTENEIRLAGTKPVLRDSTVLYKYGTKIAPGANAGWRAWRLRVTEPGVSMIHCHILQHMIMGMQTVWVFGNSSDLMRVPAPMVQGYLNYGGSVYGNETHHPDVVHFHEGP